jgi:hypothetical protein
MAMIICTIYFLCSAATINLEKKSGNNPKRFKQDIATVHQYLTTVPAVFIESPEKQGYFYNII